MTETFLTFITFLLFAVSLVLLLLWLPGNLFFLAGISGMAYFTGFQIIPLAVLGAVFVLYLIGEAFELFGAALGTRAFGASKEAAWGALAGGLLGMVIGLLGFGWGALPGLLLGVFFGAVIVEHRRRKDIAKSLTAGVGSLVGWFMGIGAKIIVAVIMLVIVLKNIYGG